MGEAKGTGTVRSKVHAADVAVKGEVLTAVIVGPGVEANRAAALLQVVGEAIRDARGRLRHIVLDLGNVVFLNSTALGAMVAISNLAREHGAATILYRPSREVVELFIRIRTQTLFAIAPTAGDLAAVIGPSREAPGDGRLAPRARA
jgi:anti-anti-sigma factor